MDVTALRRVEIEVHGEKLAHYFKELFTADWLALQRRLQELNGDQLAGALASYDARVVTVEGYEIEDEPDTTAPCDLMQARPDDWRSMVPPDHKVSAWIKLINGESISIAGAPSISTAQPEPSERD